MVERQAEVTPRSCRRSGGRRTSSPSPAPGRSCRPRTSRGMFVQLKPARQRDVSAQQFIQRIRPEVAKVRGRQRLPPGQPGSHLRRPAEPHPVPVHADLDRHRRAQSLGADPRASACAACRGAGQCHRPADRRPPCRRRGRPRHGLSARRLAVGDRPDPLRHVRRAPGRDDLRCGHAIQGPAGSDGGLRAGPGRRCPASTCRAPTACRCR